MGILVFKIANGITSDIVLSTQHKEFKFNSSYVNNEGAAYLGV